MKTFGWIDALQLILIALKLAEVGVVASWSWWLVLLPINIALSLFLMVLISCCILAYKRGTNLTTAIDERIYFYKKSLGKKDE